MHKLIRYSFSCLSCVVHTRRNAVDADTRPLNVLGRTPYQSDGAVLVGGGGGCLFGVSLQSAHRS